MCDVHKIDADFIKVTKFLEEKCTEEKRMLNN
jgi:hypothetical protein